MRTRWITTGPNTCLLKKNCCTADARIDVCFTVRPFQAWSIFDIELERKHSQMRIVLY
jgi:hypothetical protein